MPSGFRNFFRNLNFDFAPQEQEPELEDDSPIRRILEQLNFDTPSLEQYNEHVQNVPSRRDYSPSIWRRIGAGLAGGAAGLNNPSAGVEVASRIIDRPYQRALEDWSNKEQGLRAASQIEGSNQGRRAQYINSLADHDTASMRDKTANRKIDADLEQFDTESDIKKNELDIKRFDAETRRKVASLTEQRNNSTDENAKKRLSAEINRWNQDRAVARERIASVDRRTEVIKNKPVGKGSQPKPRYVSPNMINTAEIQTGQELLNKPVNIDGQTVDFSDIKDYVTFDRTSGVTIERPNRGLFKNQSSINNINKMIDLFLDLIKKQSKSRYSTTIDSEDNDEFELEEIK